MRRQYNKIRSRAALTLLEMIIALSISTVIFAVIPPILRSIRNSWEIKQANAETMQNSSMLADHLNRNLAKAVRIIAVSDPSITNGYIQFEDNTGNNLRYEVAGNYVQFGVVNNLGDLAGPVSQFRFSCYDSDDLDTPIPDLSDLYSIRFIEAETTLTNSSPLGQNETFTTSAYIRTNANIWEEGITPKTPFEFNSFDGKAPALAQIDNTHYLCAYGGWDFDGYAVVLTVNLATWAITKGTSFEFDTQNGETPALSKIDNTHYLCVYEGDGEDGWATVLTVNTGTWTITKGTSFEFDIQEGKTPALSKIDNTHYLCAYSGNGFDGWATVLTVDTDTWLITKETPFEFDTQTGETPALSKIDNTHYLCAYSGRNDDGWATVLTVNTGTWAVTKETPFEFDTQKGGTPALSKIDDDNYLCAYSDNNNDGWTVVLVVDPSDWTISKGTPFEYDISEGNLPALEKIDDNYYLCAYQGENDDGWSVVLEEGLKVKP